MMTNKALLHRIYQALEPYRSKLIISMLAMAAVALCTGAQTYMIKDGLDKIFIEKNAFYLYSFTVIIILIFGIKGVFYYTYDVLL